MLACFVTLPACFADTPIRTHVNQIDRNNQPSEPGSSNHATTIPNNANHANNTESWTPDDIPSFPDLVGAPAAAPTTSSQPSPEAKDQSTSANTEADGPGDNVESENEEGHIPRVTLKFASPGGGFEAQLQRTQKLLVETLQHNEKLSDELSTQKKACARLKYKKKK